MVTANIPVGSDKVREDLAAAGVKLRNGQVAPPSNKSTKQAKLEAKRKAQDEREVKRIAAEAEKVRKREEREARAAEKKRLADLEILQRKLGKLDKQLASAVDKAIKAATHPELKPMISMVMGKPVQMPRVGDKHYECMEYVRPLYEQGKDTNDIISMVQKKFDFSRGLAKNYTIMAIERIECGAPPKKEVLKAAEQAKEVVEQTFEQKRQELIDELAKIQEVA